MLVSQLKGAFEWALMVAVVFGAGAVAQAQDNKLKSDEDVVQIGQADAGQVVPKSENATEQARPEMPKYWIGLLGGAISADDPLRAHLDLPQGQGLIVENVVPDSPAAKAGLKKHDILLRANDTALSDMRQLVDLVATAGEKKAQITLEVFRHGNRESAYLTPEERPADANVPAPNGGGGFGGGFGGGEFRLPDEFRGQLMERFGKNGPMEFRSFGPGVMFGEGHGVSNLPNDISISIQKEDGQPAKVTVKRGKETWEVTGDDEKSLKQLPDDVRPYVEQMLHGQTMNFQNFVPPNLGQGRGREESGLRERLDQMEKRMEQLMERFNHGDQPVDQQKDQKEQAK